ncbi:MAG: hypothetical protein K9L21_04570 [Spirochaetia bacterium]|nr:hypothetical protein [Spirochaetia bacterium]
MKKQQFLFVILLLTAAVAATAQGTQDMASGAAGSRNTSGSRETVQITGILEIQEQAVLLVTSEGAYTLIAPQSRSQIQDYERFNGVEAAVSGILFELDETGADCTYPCLGQIVIQTARTGSEEITFNAARQGAGRSESGAGK